MLPGLQTTSVLSAQTSSCMFLLDAQLRHLGFGKHWCSVDEMRIVVWLLIISPSQIQVYTDWFATAKDAKGSMFYTVSFTAESGRAVLAGSIATSCSVTEPSKRLRGRFLVSPKHSRSKPCGRCTINGKNVLFLSKTSLHARQWGLFGRYGGRQFCTFWRTACCVQHVSTPLRVDRRCFLLCLLHL